ncbi:MAG TPA: aldo/keto reductase [Sediminispirochaeta sp.]|nr:aldo/keto reductase [Sediminispirochaeta sp.]
MTIHSTCTLNNGVKIPWLGLGVYKSKEGPEVENAVRWALEIGYRHIDTASMYENETGVGKAIAESSVDREDIFLTTKVWNDEQGYQKTLAAFDRSRSKLRSDVIDLYLIHWPVKESFKETWKAMEKLYAEGKVRAIGVSNFLIHHLKELLVDFDVVPAVDQVEWHPFLRQRELHEFCSDSGIQLEAWSPLTRGRMLDHQVINEIAEAHGKSPAQILIRWDLQHEVVTIPKSVHRERILENSRVFDFVLSSDEMSRLDALDSETRFGKHPDEMS